MDKQKIVIILLIVSIIFSGVSAVMSFSSDSGSSGLVSPDSCKDIVTCTGDTASATGSVGLRIVEDPNA